MLNRTICDIFEEMRKCNKTSNYSYLSGLIEEAQSAANRMESALYDQSDLRCATKELKEVKAKIKEQKKKLKDE